MTPKDRAIAATIMVVLGGLAVWCNTHSHPYLALVLASCSGAFAEHFTVTGRAGVEAGGDVL